MDDTLLDPQQPNLSTLRTVSWVAYALFALGFLTSGLFALGPIAAVIMIYLKRSDAAGTIYAQHFDWLLSTFFWGLLWLIVSYILIFVLIGWIALGITLLWLLYRLIKGVLAMLDYRAP